MDVVHSSKRRLIRVCSSLRGARRSSSGSDPSLFEGIFPSSQRRGGCAVNEKPRSYLIPLRRGGQFGCVLPIYHDRRKHRLDDPSTLSIFSAAVVWNASVSG